MGSHEIKLVRLAKFVLKLLFKIFRLLQTNYVCLVGFYIINDRFKSFWPAQIYVAFIVLLLFFKIPSQNRQVVPFV